jgi:hypothetical protein
MTWDDVLFTTLSFMALCVVPTAGMLVAERWSHNRLVEDTPPGLRFLIARSAWAVRRRASSGPSTSAGAPS